MAEKSELLTNISSYTATSSDVSANVSANITSEIQPLGMDSAIVINALMTLFLAYIITRAVAFFLTWVSERIYEHRITVKMAIPLLKFTIYGFAAYHILSSILQLSTAQLVAFSGLAGAAIGFGLKDLVAEVVGGIVIVLDKPYQVGDKIKINEHYGEVRDIGLRATRIVSPDDSLISISNQKILSQILSNANAGSQEMMVVIDLFIDAQSDALRAMQILKEAALTSRYVFISEKRPFKVLLKDYPLYRRVRAKAYVFDLRHEFDFESDVTKRAWQAFREEGIKPPRIGVIDSGYAGEGRP
jgi:small-conductance mechanosensitive channel